MVLRQVAIAVFVAATLLPGNARADVLEIGDAGARWVATGSSAGAGDADGRRNLVPEFPADGLSELGAAADRLPDQYEGIVAMLAAKYDLSPSLIEALVWQESRWREGAVSPVGARGLAQLMPGTARDMGVDPHDPAANLEGGARYLRIQLDRFGGDIELALAAYNSGPARVERAGGIPRIRETENYVAAIMGRLSDQSGR